MSETERTREALDVVSRYGAACVRYGEGREGALQEAAALEAALRAALGATALEPVAWMVKWHAVSDNGHPYGGEMPFLNRSRAEEFAEDMAKLNVGAVSEFHPLVYSPSLPVAPSEPEGARYEVWARQAALDAADCSCRDAATWIANAACGHDSGEWGTRATLIIHGATGEGERE